MDPQDPSQRPSIFSKPDPSDERYTPEPEQPRTSPRVRPMGSYLPDPEPVPPSGPSRRLLVGLTAGGLLLLVIGGFVAGSLLGPDDAAIGAVSPSLTPSISPPLLPSPTPQPSTTPLPSPTPAPTPAGPPQDVAVGSWATVTVDELSVRSAASTDAASNNILVRGAVMHVAEGPTVVGGLNWYRIASLGGTVGWVNSGWIAQPFVKTLVEDPILIRCGRVNRAVFDIVDGVPVAHDPLLIGDLALPAARFSERSLGAIELLRGIGEDACFNAQVGADGMPIVTAQLSVNACGRVVRDGSFFRLRPAAGQGVPPEYQVKDPVVVQPALLTSVMVNDPKSENLRRVANLIAAGNDETGCLNVNVSGDVGSVTESTSLSTEQCLKVYDQSNDVITLGTAAGGDRTMLFMTEGSSAYYSFPLGVPLFMYVNVGGSDGGSFGNFYQGQDASCP